MRYSRALGTAVGVLLLAASTAWADVHLTMANGRVTLVAKDATLRQIMTEWARVGQTKVVNVERIPGGPMTLELTNVTEEQALSVLMRPLSGYVAAPRAIDAAGVSRYDRILVMPTVAAARQAPAASATSSSVPAPVFQTGPLVTMPTQAPDEDADERAAPPVPGRTPIFTSFPQPQVVNPGNAPANGYVVPPGMQLPSPPPVPPQPTATAVPTAPGGVAVPGMLVPVPTQPGAQAPGTLVKRPGGE